MRAHNLLQVLDSYQALWAQLEDLDSHTQLLDPPATLQQPYAHASRCIALGHGCSMQLQLSPASPAAPPHVTFHGPSSRVAALQTRWYASAAQAWDAQLLVRRNVEAVLQVRCALSCLHARVGLRRAVLTLALLSALRCCHAPAVAACAQAAQPQGVCGAGSSRARAAARQPGQRVRAAEHG